MQNFKCFSKHLLQKTKSVFCHNERLPVANNNQFNALTLSCNIPNLIFYSAVGIPGSGRPHPPLNTEPICCPNAYLKH